MNEQLKNVRQVQPLATEPTKKEKRKKKYSKPELVYQAPLEAMAAACSTFPGKAQGACGTAFS